MTSCAITCPECGHRIEPLRKEVLRYGPLVLRVDVALLKVGLGKPVRVPRNEAQVLGELMRHHDRVCTKDHLLTAGDHWGDVEPRTLDVWIWRLRNKIEGSGANIVTIRGEGYMLTARNAAPFLERPKASAEQVARAATLVGKGWSISATARCLNVANSAVRAAAVVAGVWPRPQP